MNQAIRRWRLQRLRQLRPRQACEESASFSGNARDADLAALRLDDVPGERQSQSGALVLLGRAGVELLKFNEQTFDVLGFDADAGVLDLEDRNRLARPAASRSSPTPLRE